MKYYAIELRTKSFDSLFVPIKSTHLLSEADFKIIYKQMENTLARLYIRYEDLKNYNKFYITSLNFPTGDTITHLFVRTLNKDKSVPSKKFAYVASALELPGFELSRQRTMGNVRMDELAEGYGVIDFLGLDNILDDLDNYRTIATYNKIAFRNYPLDYL